MYKNTRVTDGTLFQDDLGKVARRHSAIFCDNLHKPVP